MEPKNKNGQVYPLNGIRVCIHEYCGDLKGEIYSKMREKPIYFNSCSEMLVRADRFFDECGYPQTFQERRKFVEDDKIRSYTYPQPCLSDEEIWSHQGKYCTVDILVQSRMRAGWQGIVMWGEGIPPSRFQSEMELLECLMQINDSSAG